MTGRAAVRVVICGHVQGVYFRAFIQKHARELGVTGYVRNLPGEDAVEAWGEGEKECLEALLGHLRVGPPGARVDRVVTNWEIETGKYPDFSIRY
jgi:acylphosphatase